MRQPAMLLTAIALAVALGACAPPDRRDDSERGEPWDRTLPDVVTHLRDLVPPGSRVAVYPPSVDGEQTDLGMTLATELETECARGAAGRFGVITRSQLDAVMSEQHLQVTDLFDPVRQVEIGRLVGADHVISGALYHHWRDTWRWNIQVIDTTTGTIVAGDRRYITVRRKPRIFTVSSGD